jgi:hypothetical protein
MVNHYGKLNGQQYVCVYPQHLRIKPIVFVDDLGKVYKDVHNLTDAREAGLLAKEKEAQGPVLVSIFLQVSAVCQTTCCGPPKCAVQERPNPFK